MDLKIGTCNVVQCAETESTLKKLHMLTEEHMENQVVLHSITKNMVQPEEVNQLEQIIGKFKVCIDLFFMSK